MRSTTVSLRPATTSRGKRTWVVQLSWYVNKGPEAWGKLCDAIEEAVRATIGGQRPERGKRGTDRVRWEIRSVKTLHKISNLKLLHDRLGAAMEPFGFEVLDVDWDKHPQYFEDDRPPAADSPEARTLKALRIAAKAVQAAIDLLEKK
jgi:hypothetical protein